MPANLGDFLDQLSVQYNTSAAYSSGGVSPRAVTYHGLCQHASSGAAFLQIHHVKKGDHVILFAEPSADWMIAFFSILKAGAVVVPVPHLSSAQQLLEIASLSQAKNILYSARTAPTVHAAPSVALPNGLTELLAFTGKKPPIQISADVIAIKTYSQNSTCVSPPIQLTHQAILSALKELMSREPKNNEEIYLSLLPPHDLFELQVGQLSVLGRGGKIVFSTNLSPSAIPAVIREEKVTQMVFTADLMREIFNEATVSKFFGTPLKTISLPEIHFDAAIKEKLGSAGINVRSLADFGY